MPCKVCGGINNKTFTIYEMMFGTRELFIYNECSGCGCLQISEIPRDMSKYYPSDYYSQRSSVFLFFKNPITRFILKIRTKYALYDKNLLGNLFYEIKSRPSLRSLSKVKLTKDTRILDVGCGNGYDLYLLKEMGFKNLLGIDPFIDQDIHYDNGLTILKKELFKLQGTWDIILLNHVLEHMPEPVRSLQQIHKLLSKDSVCIIRTPVIPCYAWEHFGTNWMDLDAPRHFTIFSEKSIKILCQKLNYNINSDETYYDSSEFQLLGSHQYSKSIPWESPKSAKNNLFKLIISIPKIIGFKIKAKKLNAQKRGSQAVFYLRKR